MKQETQSLSVDAELYEWRLINHAVKGSFAAFTALYARYLEETYRYIYLWIGDEAASEVLTEEVFVRAWENLPGDRFVGAHTFLLWVYRMACSLATAYNKQTVQDELWAYDEDHQNGNNGYHAVPSPPPNDETALGLQSTRLVSALRQLDDIERQVILLRIVSRLSHKEVGAIIGESEAEARVLQYHALLALRRILFPRQRGEFPYSVDRVHTISFCIDQVVSEEWTLEQCLTRLPTYRKELEATLSCALTVSQARHLRPRRAFRDEAPKRLAKRLKQSMRRTQATALPAAVGQNQPLPAQGRVMRWPVVIAALVLVLLGTLGGTAATVAAADASVPGDVLYSLDLGIEERRLQFARDAQSATMLRLAFAEERLNEAEELAARGDKQNLQMALVAYSVQIGAVAAKVNEGMEVATMGPILDETLARQQNRLNRVFVGMSAGYEQALAANGDEEVFCKATNDPAFQVHPVGASLSTQYNTPYPDVMAWFCGGHSFGEIMLALATADKNETALSPGELLALKGNEGWGTTLHKAQLGILPPAAAGPPAGTGTPAILGSSAQDEPPGQAGRPDVAGPPGKDEPPGQAGRPDEPGRPADAGPPPGQDGRPSNPGNSGGNNGNNGGGQPDNPGNSGNNGGGQPGNPGNSGGNSGGGQPGNPGN